MTANRMFSADPARSGSWEAVVTTIVGGRPPASRRTVQNVPRGIEVLLKKAAIDAAFRDHLLQTRSQAAGLIGLTLDETEAAVINSLPEKSLVSMIERAEVPNAHRAAFLGSVAAIMLAALGVVNTANADIPVTGILPDRPGIKPILKWTGLADHNYDIYFSEDMKTWNYLATVRGVDGAMSFTDQAANWEAAPKRFYKIAQQTATRGVTSDVPAKLQIICERVPD